VLLPAPLEDPAVTAPTSIIEGFSLNHAQILDGTETFEEALARTDLEGWDIYGVNEASLDPDTDQYINEGDDVQLSVWNWLNGADVSVQAGYISFPLMANLTGEDVTESGGTSEVQTLTATGPPTAGTFTINFDGQTATGVAFNATATAIRDKLAALSNLDAGDITVTGGPINTTPVVVTFDLAEGDVPVMTINNAGLTGGTVAVATTTPGTGGQDDTIYEIPLWTEDSFNVPPKPMLATMPSKDHLGNVRLFVIGLYRVQFAPFTFDGPKYKEGLKINYGGRATMSAWDETGAAFAGSKKRVGTLVSRPRL
jgi:hypothetical protein